MIGLALISDRADLYLPGCVDSLHHLPDLPCTVIDDRDHRLGLAGAVRAAWDWALNSNVDYLLHVEEDFRFTRRFDPQWAVDILHADPRLAQVVLKRQPWSPEEHHAGGIIECHPEDYTQEQDGDLWWVSHQRIFSLNPCVIPRHILELGWPDGNEAEMTSNLVALGYRFAFYGHRDDQPRVHHVGIQRAPGWRL